MCRYFFVRHVIHPNDTLCHNSLTQKSKKSEPHFIRAVLTFHFLQPRYNNDIPPNTHRKNQTEPSLLLDTLQEPQLQHRYKFLQGWHSATNSMTHKPDKETKPHRCIRGRSAQVYLLARPQPSLGWEESGDEGCGNSALNPLTSSPSTALQSGWKGGERGVWGVVTREHHAASRKSVDGSEIRMRFTCVSEYAGDVALIIAWLLDAGELYFLLPLFIFFFMLWTLMLNVR